jgi:hypothetical protein
MITLPLRSSCAIFIEKNPSVELFASAGPAAVLALNIQGGCPLVLSGGLAVRSNTVPAADSSPKSL